MKWRNAAGPDESSDSSMLLDQQVRQLQSVSLYDLRILGLLLIGVFGSTCVAQAGVILSPTAAIGNDFGNRVFSGFSYEEARMFDQSGLSTTFSSGTDDFSTYIASGPTHTPSSGNFMWSSPQNPSFPGNVDFDLGSEVTIEQLALWTDDQFGPNGITVLTSNQSNFSTSTNVASITPADVTNAPVPVQVFDLTDSSARYVRFAITGSHNSQFATIAEIAFDTSAASSGGGGGGGGSGGTAIPEPSGLALLGLAACALGIIYSRRSNDQSQHNRIQDGAETYGRSMVCHR